MGRICEHFQGFRPVLPEIRRRKPGADLPLAAEWHERCDSLSRRRTPLSQCGILFIGLCGSDEPRIASLRSLGFHVAESTELPTSEELAAFHAIIVRAWPDCRLPMLAARLRARARFGRRALIALVAASVSERDKRDAIMSGFDQILGGTCSARDIAAWVLRLLRPFPEYRCLLRAPNGRRKAA